MPKEKIETILLYNEQDVVNLYKIFITWKDYIQSEDEVDEVIEVDSHKDNIEITEEESDNKEVIEENKEEIEVNEIENTEDCIVD